MPVIDSRKRRPGGQQEESAAQAQGSADAGMTSLFEEKPRVKGKSVKPQNRLSKAELEELERQKEREVQRGYQRILQLWPAMLRREDEAEREWLLEAEKLVESFRETRSLFVTQSVCPLRITRCAFFSAADSSVAVVASFSRPVPHVNTRSQGPRVGRR